MRNKPKVHSRTRITDTVMQFLVYLAGAAILFSIIAIFYYLSSESRYALNRMFTYGFLFALQSKEMDKTLPEYSDISYDVNASVLSVHPEGSEDPPDVPDAKEERTPMPTLDQLAGAYGVATGTVLGGNLSAIKESLLFKDDFREPKHAESEHRFVLFAFATPEYKLPTMDLVWDTHEGSNPSLAPFDLKFRMIQAPKGVQLNPIEIDLKSKPKGRLEIPSFVAKTDADRTEGYVFELIATPKTVNGLAALANFVKTEWAPTFAHPRFGFFPLLLATLTITLMAVLFAGPIAIASAIYLAELAPARIRELLKPLIELLASIPTIVLGIFGLMLVAPVVQNTFAKAFGIESGRNLLTASIMMGVLLVPTIMTLAEDALRSVPSILRDGGEALGLTRIEALRKVVLPAARPGLVAALMLGVARAFGETMIVWVLSGGTPTMPNFNSFRDAAANLVRPARGIPDTIGIEMGNVTFEEPHYGHLFLLGLTLFVITLTINLIAFRFARRQAWRQ